MFARLTSSHDYSAILETGAPAMILTAKDLSPEQKGLIEGLLGRPVLEKELISLRTIESPALSDSRRQELAAELREYFAKVDALRKPTSAEAEEEILTEAMRTVRPNYSPLK